MMKGYKNYSNEVLCPFICEETCLFRTLLTKNLLDNLLSIKKSVLPTSTYTLLSHEWVTGKVIASSLTRVHDEYFESFVFDDFIILFTGKSQRYFLVPV